jgi:dihydropteroate synthase
MHLRGDFTSMHQLPYYEDVMDEVKVELNQRMEDARQRGVSIDQLILDPGIGFAKAAPHSLEVLRRLPELSALGRPVLVGASRKSFIGTVLGAPTGERLYGSLAAAAAAVMAGAHIVRVHDVPETVAVVRLCDAVRGGA